MNVTKYKHLTLDDRYLIQDFLNAGKSFSEIAEVLGKDRRAIAKEVKKHRFMKNASFDCMDICPKTTRAPYVCNACNTCINCKMQQFRYEANIANVEYLRTLSSARQVPHISKEQIADINATIAPLMVFKHHSINQVYANHPEILPFSISTFYRYVDSGLINVTNTALIHKKCTRVRVKRHKTASQSCLHSNDGRSYNDFRKYMEYHPQASIVEMDTVIGQQGKKGGKCILTLLFRQFNFMLIFLLPYKQNEYVVKTFSYLKSLLGVDEFKRLFEVILTDNGSEFTNPELIENDAGNVGTNITKIFYCDTYSPWQKGSIEKNHEFIRYVFPKGTSFAGLTQTDCNLLASHINAIPRKSLHNKTPYEMAIGFIGKENVAKLGISFVEKDNVNLTKELFYKRK